MKTRLKRVAAGIIAAAFMIGIVACSIMPITREPPAPEAVKEADAPAVGEPEVAPAPPADFDIVAGLKLKEKDGVKTKNTGRSLIIIQLNHFTNQYSHFGHK